MDYSRILETLSDDRCGLFFLAGLDEKKPLGCLSLTIHATQATLTQDNIHFMQTAVTALNPRIEVLVRLHSPSELYAPDSLQAFARSFRHERILSDPTGAFARVTKLLDLSRAIRSELGSRVARLVWQADASALVVVTSPMAAGGAGQDGPEDLALLELRLKTLLASECCPDLKKAIRFLRVTDKAPSSRYTPVDSLSAESRKGQGVARVLARLSGVAALIGLGALSAAHAGTSDLSEEGQNALPGITALVGLTTLGENSYGLRNRFQAVGGLRLYLGPSEVLVASVIAPAAPCVPACGPDSNPEAEEEIEAVPQQISPTWPKPTRIQYG